MTIRPTARELLRDWARRRMKECLAEGDLVGYAEWFVRAMKYTG